MLDLEKMARLRRKVIGPQVALAKLMGVTVRTVSRWENGGGFPDPPHLRAIAAALGVHVADLFSRPGQ